MSLKIDLEREFFKAARDLEKKSEVKREFMTRTQKLSEDWIDNKLRWDIACLKEE
ncbi:MAG: hypothetical protein KKD17_05005 [Nanoarchaeota archaeon]|nr:hypothetical protein [Nanoarchaeota archaeon]